MDPQVIQFNAAKRRAEAREAAKLPENWGADTQSLRLPANTNDETGRVEIVAGGKGKPPKAAFRSDCFDLLHSRGKLNDAGHRAARRLQSDLAIRFGLSGPGTWCPPAVDDAGRPGEMTNRMLDKALEMDRLLWPSCGARAKALLLALTEPGVIQGQVIVWKVVVTRVTGESDQHDALGALVRAACDDLAAAYEAMDRLPKAGRVG